MAAICEQPTNLSQDGQEQPDPQQPLPDGVTGNNPTRSSSGKLARCKTCCGAFLIPGVWWPFGVETKFNCPE